MVATVSELSKTGRGLYLVKKLFNFVFLCVCVLSSRAPAVCICICVSGRKGGNRHRGRELWWTG